MYLHHDYWRTATFEDWKTIDKIRTCVKQPMNLFYPRGNQSIWNIVTGNAIDNETIHFLLECQAETKKSYEEFKNRRLSGNDKQLLMSFQR